MTAQFRLRVASPRSLTIIVLAGLLGAALVIWHFGFREFYYDCAEQVNLGEEVRRAHFLVNHGRLAGPFARPLFSPDRPRVPPGAQASGSCSLRLEVPEAAGRQRTPPRHSQPF